MDHLRIGLPSKGRLAEQAAELMQQAGLAFRRQERSLFARVREMPVDVTFLRPRTSRSCARRVPSTWVSPGATW